MRSRSLFLSLAAFFTVLTAIITGVFAFPKIRWDKVPVVRFFVLEINLYPSGFDAEYLDEPIKWYQLKKEPEDFSEKGAGPWFAVNPYTLNLLENYMYKNNLGIVPGSWPDLQITSNFEECLETFEFVSLGEPMPKIKCQSIYFTRLSALPPLCRCCFWCCTLLPNAGILHISSDETIKARKYSVGMALGEIFYERKIFRFYFRYVYFQNY